MNSTHKDKLYCMTVHVLMLSDPNVASTSLVTMCCFTKSVMWQFRATETHY